MPDPPEPSPGLPIAGPSVPVFDCHVLLRQTQDGYEARTANLAGLTATGASERDALMAIVKSFKAVVREHVQQHEPIPFLQPPEQPKTDEVERWIPVHL